jgi:hypothetical protein
LSKATSSAGRKRAEQKLQEDERDLRAIADAIRQLLS